MDEDNPPWHEDLLVWLIFPTILLVCCCVICLTFISDRLLTGCISSITRTFKSLCGCCTICCRASGDRGGRYKKDTTVVASDRSSKTTTPAPEQKKKSKKSGFTCAGCCNKVLDFLFCGYSCGTASTRRVGTKKPTAVPSEAVVTDARLSVLGDTDKLPLLSIV